MNAQTNLKTGNAYAGVNQSILQEVKSKTGYSSDKWITYCQAREIGKKLVGAKGKGINLRTFAKDTDKNTKGKIVEVTRPISFFVFNEDLLQDVVVA